MENIEEKTLFGFWVYLMTDCLLFGTLFATYAVLHTNSQGFFNLPFALTETLILLASSFTCGLTFTSSRRNQPLHVIGWFGVTFLLGIAFLAMELTEFTHLAREGNSWQKNGFLSAYFTLVGTHGLHISLGLLWMVVMIVQIFRNGLIPTVLRRLKCLRLFWHFLDLVWIFIFTIVYLMGEIGSYGN